MKINNLWSNLEPLESTIKTVKEDYKRGITPELPYFIVGQSDITEDVEKKIKEIDLEYLNKSFIIGEYGNGKTNLLKYLELYCKQYGSQGEKKLYASYKRADIENPDIFLIILNHIESKFKDELLKSIKTINSFVEPLNIYKKIMHNFIGFENIQEYINVISETKDDEDIIKLIFLGTGRLYTKNNWGNFKLKQLNDFDRREITVLFLNILAENKRYIIFEIDELEKVREKSSVRFRNFLTSFRELLDLAKFIKGHYVIVTMTAAISNYENILGENPAFYSRIKSDTKVLKSIVKIEEKRILLKLLISLFKVKITDLEAEKIIINTNRNFKTLSQNNRLLVSEYVSKLLNKENPIYSFEFDKAIKEAKIETLFKNKKEELEYIHEFKNIHNKLTEPLSYYLASKNYEFEYKDRILNITDDNKSIILNFSENTIKKDIEIYRTLNASNANRVFILKSDKYELYSSKDINFDENILIINYNPDNLLILLELYNEQIDFRGVIDQIIINYLKGVL